MKYRNKREAKEYAKKNMRGAWGAFTTPFTPDLKIDEDGFRHNIRHCVEIGVKGMFFNGFMNEFWAITPAERKLITKMAVEEAKGKMDIMPQTGDQSLESTLDLTKHAQEVGADWAIIINPKWTGGVEPLSEAQEDGVFEYYKYICDRVDIGVAIFNQMYHGYLMSPRLVARLANELPNIVAIKHTGPEPMVKQTRILCGDKIVVSDPTEDRFLANIVMYNQEAMIANPAAFYLQGKNLQLVNEYYKLAQDGKIKEAWAVNKRLDPIRQAFTKVVPFSKMQAGIKYWCQFTGMVGGEGRARLPMVSLTEKEKQAIKAAVESTELVKEPVKVKAKA